MAMTKEEFKRRWELNDSGDGITYDDIAECAEKWGLYKTPKIHSLEEVTQKVLRSANCDC